MPVDRENDIQRTVDATVLSLKRSLRDYIEAAYHISNPSLVNQRVKILDEPGVISQLPFIETTQKFKKTRDYADIGLDAKILELLNLLSQDDGDGNRALVFPPYHHQSDAVEATLVKGKSLMVMTGTGSGKTETFMFPILGKLAKEAAYKPESFRRHRAVRALVLYPMNALVNDQLGRMRLLFGDTRLVDKFKSWSGRTVQFARYTSRTPYAGVRDASANGDGIKLKPLKDYYIDNLEIAEDPSHPDYESKRTLISELKQRGKWPAKPDLRRWWGSGRWANSEGAPQRCVTLEDDSELITRHEVKDNPPDILITNYSMLEYMLMRPVEKSIFDSTKDWLDENPDENFLLVVDEAHLYSGAQGTEVAHLIRRLRARLEIPADRFQVICTTASFASADYAPKFSADLSGKVPEDFEVIQGDVDYLAGGRPANQNEADLVSDIKIANFYRDIDDPEFRNQIKSFLGSIGADVTDDLQKDLFSILPGFPPMAHLVNLTMESAWQLSSLRKEIFPTLDEEAGENALSTMIALGTFAKSNPASASLMPCRAHAFFRGLPGLWICMDPDCSEMGEPNLDGPTSLGGKLYHQPREICGPSCGARVLEFYTCRDCGAAYARAYTDDIENPVFLWGEGGQTGPEDSEPLHPLDLLLQEPDHSMLDSVEQREYDLTTGRIDTSVPSERFRSVWLYDQEPELKVDSDDDEDEEASDSEPRQFRKCGVCTSSGVFGHSPVMDHQTKGDQPFSALVNEQIQVQYPDPSVKYSTFNSLRGRKVLGFSDSRQQAARLAPKISEYSSTDTLRPLALVGFQKLQSLPLIGDLTSLDHLYLAAQLGSHILDGRMPPGVGSEQSDESGAKDLFNAIPSADQSSMLHPFMSYAIKQQANSIRGIIHRLLKNRRFGLEALCLASVIEAPTHTKEIVKLPDIPGVAKTDEAKLALARLWIRRHILASGRNGGYKLTHMADSELAENRGFKSLFSQKFNSFLGTPDNRRIFRQQWFPYLRDRLCEVNGQNHRLLATNLSLIIGGDWVICQRCRTAQRPFPGSNKCLDCIFGDTIHLNPDTDPVFQARKGYYRSASAVALEKGLLIKPFINAAEHTAQLNQAQGNEIFALTETYELLFQDVDLGDIQGSKGYAVDFLSSTTTMEVGIDIGALSGVALRNMPPSRANYQQRAGRAGRRGNSIATVIAYGNSDTHDAHYFENPQEMIRGSVMDPFLCLDNVEIARRHVLAYLIQGYLQDTIGDAKPGEGSFERQLFSVLGTVDQFEDETETFHKKGFFAWIDGNRHDLASKLRSWLPAELGKHTLTLVNEISIWVRQQIALALDDNPELMEQSGKENEQLPAEGIDQEDAPEVQETEGVEKQPVNPNSAKLLERLFARGVLPKYAFPTDLATFYVFDEANSDQFRARFLYTPSYATRMSLSTYAPGKGVYIDSQEWTSGAIYSPIKGQRSLSWEQRQLYFECLRCGFAKVEPVSETATLNGLEDCPACAGVKTLGPASNWMKPPGFAHPIDIKPKNTVDEFDERTYPTKAVLTAGTLDDSGWKVVNERVMSHGDRADLLVTNRGLLRRNAYRGFAYCTWCGRIDVAGTRKPNLELGHIKPVPTYEACDKAHMVSPKVMLGTRFITDILLLRFKLIPPAILLPGELATKVALTTICAAIAKAGSRVLLDRNSNELEANFRPALTPGGADGSEIEIYVYDTLAGGAGFSTQLAEDPVTLLETARNILVDCACESSCYSCLRSFNNKLEHSKLDRLLGANLLGYLLDGEITEYDLERRDQTTDRLFEDLLRLNLDIEVFRNKTVLGADLGMSDVLAPIYIRSTITGDEREFIYGLHSSLTPQHVQDNALMDYKENQLAIGIQLKDEYDVRRNLSKISAGILDAIGVNS